MRLSVLLLVALVASLSLFAAARRDYDLSLPKEDLFEMYLQDYAVDVEANSELYQRHKAVFSENLKKIHHLNHANPKAQFGLNKFSLMTDEEFKAVYMGHDMPEWWTPGPDAEYVPEYTEEEISSVPDAFDWRKKGAVTPVKNQGACGSCWSFSTTGNVEGQWQIAGNKLVSLSEQNLMDCSHKLINGTKDMGCQGGMMQNAFEYIISNKGIDTEASYPYEAQNGQCRFKRADVGATIDGYEFVPRDSDQMKAYLANKGPISVAMDAATWQFYWGGVVYWPCGTTLDHGILIVGYDTETDILGQTMPYWIVKNSWGPDWGEDGYIYIERGNNENECGIEQYPISSYIKKN